MSRQLIDSLSQAVNQNPTDVALRLHLAKLLLDAHEAKEALRHCTHVLSNSPDTLEAIELAAAAARLAGEERIAQGYAKLYVALSGNAPNIPNPPLNMPPQAPQAPQATGEPTPLKAPVPEQADINPRVWDDVPVVFDDSDDDDDVAQKYKTWRGEEVEEEIVVPDDEITLEKLDQLWEMELPRITLKDVAGMEAVKRRLNLNFLAPMRDPKLRQHFKKKLRGGLLLYGPPGCGKTYIARAAAGELGAKFISVGISDVLDMWLGNSEKNMHEIFQMARRNAPCVLFLDEIDALGHKRTNLKYSAGRNVINQLLYETDSANYDNEGIFLLGATNHPWDVDSALKRPGRLDRTLLVLPPDAAARRRVLEMNMQDRPSDMLNLDRVLDGTEGYSCADLVALCEAATELAMEEYVERGVIRNVNEVDFKRAKREVRPSTLAWFEAARNYAMFANEGGAYDDLIDYLRARKLL